MGNARATVSIPADLLADADREAKARRLNRSEFVEAALRVYLAQLAEEELEGRLGLGRKVEDVAELVDTRTGDVARLVGKVSDQEKALIILAVQAAERVYALLEAQFSHNARLTFEEAQEMARRRVHEQRRPGTPLQSDDSRLGKEGG